MKEEKQKNKSLALALLCLLAACCLTGLFLLCRNAGESRQYIAELDGERISLSEYKIYLYAQKRRFETLGGEDIWEIDFDGKTAESIAKQYALDNIAMVRISLREAERLGIVLSEEERVGLDERGEEMYEVNRTFSEQNGVTSVDWKKMNRDYALYQKLYERITGDFVPGREDFDSYFRQYYETNRRELVGVEAQVIWIKLQKTENSRPAILTAEEQTRAWDTAKDVYLRVLDLAEEEGKTGLGENAFKALAEEYDDAVVAFPAFMDGEQFPEEVMDAGYSLREGEISSLLTTANGYYILWITAVIEPDMQALEEEQWGEYTAIKKSEIFDREYQKWFRNATVVKNQKVWEEVTVEGLN